MIYPTFSKHPTQTYEHIYQHGRVQGQERALLHQHRSRTGSGHEQSLAHSNLNGIYIETGD